MAVQDDTYSRESFEICVKTLYGGQAIFLYDDYDEVAPNERDMMLMRAIQATKVLFRKNMSRTIAEMVRFWNEKNHAAEGILAWERTGAEKNGQALLRKALHQIFD